MFLNQCTDCRHRPCTEYFFPVILSLVFKEMPVLPKDPPVMRQTCFTIGVSLSDACLVTSHLADAFIPCDVLDTYLITRTVLQEPSQVMYLAEGCLRWQSWKDESSQPDSNNRPISLIISSPIFVNFCSWGLNSNPSLLLSRLISCELLWMAVFAILDKFSIQFSSVVRCSSSLIQFGCSCSVH